MIKGEVTVVGTIAHNAVEKKSNEGNTFLSFPLELTVKGRDNTSAKLTFNVSCDGDKNTASIYTQGRKVEVLVPPTTTFVLMVVSNSRRAPMRRALRELWSSRASWVRNPLAHIQTNTANFSRRSQGSQWTNSRKTESTHGYASSILLLLPTLL